MYGSCRNRVHWRGKIMVFWGLLLSLHGCTPAFAQDTVVRFTNANPVITVPILNGSTPTIDQDGNIYAECELQTGLGTCEGLDTTPAGSPPTLTLARIDAANPVTTATGITLQWVTGNAPTLCTASASPSDAAWAGAKSVNGGSQAITFASTGSKTYSMTCYNATGASPTRSVTVSVQSGSTPPPVTGCDTIPSIGKSLSQRQWTSVFFNSNGTRGLPFFVPTTYLHPVGSYSTTTSTGGSGLSSGLAMSTHYLSIPFVAEAGVRYGLDWADAQPLSYAGYNPARPAHDAFVTISPCRGDFRAENNSSSDTFLKRGCRRGGEKNNINFGAGYTSTTTSNCALTAGQTYYVNINLTCSSGTKCEINMLPNFR